MWGRVWPKKRQKLKELALYSFVILEMPSPPSSNRPAAAVVVMQVRVGLGAIRRLHRFEIPLQLSADAKGDIAQKRRLGKRTGVVKATSGGAAEFDGVDPLSV